MPTQTDRHEKSPGSQRPSQKSYASGNWKEVENAVADVKETFGFVPTFINNLPESTKPGAWAEAKSLRFSTETALDTKLKGLISLSISAQIPCEKISYFEQMATVADGATREEQLEAVMMSAITRHWSTVLNGSQMDKIEFRKEVESVMQYVREMMNVSPDKLPSEEDFLVKPATSSEAYKDIEKTLGIVPQFFREFPSECIAGAWSEFKALQLNPYTALSGKQKELIGLAVASQIPCEYCITFHKHAADLNGATEREMKEAIGLSALTRHWSTIFHGPQIEEAAFTRDIDQMVRYTSQHRMQ